MICDHKGAVHQSGQREEPCKEGWELGAAGTLNGAVLLQPSGKNASRVRHKAESYKGSRAEVRESDLVARTLPGSCMRLLAC